MTSARVRCWIHEDCLADLELSIACGSNPLDMQVLDGEWAEVADFGGGYNYGNGIGGGYGGYGGSLGNGDGYGDSYEGDGAGGGHFGGRSDGEVDGGQR